MGVAALHMPCVRRVINRSSFVPLWVAGGKAVLDRLDDRDYDECRRSDPQHGKHGAVHDA